MSADDERIMGESPRFVRDGDIGLPGQHRPWLLTDIPTQIVATVLVLGVLQFLAVDLFTRHLWYDQVFLILFRATMRFVLWASMGGLAGLAMSKSGPRTMPRATFIGAIVGLILASVPLLPDVR
jgi:hypothetical protein